MLLNISIVDFMKLQNPNVIDIRSIESYNNNHIPGAINIPSDQLLVCPNKYLNRNIRYYIYCTKGITSSKVCNILLRSGYNVTNLVGGYEEWLIKSK